MRMKQLLANYRQNKLLYWLILPSLIFILIFNYIPMGGLIIAFQDYSLLVVFGEANGLALKTLQTSFLACILDVPWAIHWL